jgi:hypothetical protein
MQQQALEAVNHVFELFTSWLDEMLTYAQTRPVHDWISPLPINPEALGV